MNTFHPNKLCLAKEEALLLIVDVQEKLCPAMDLSWLNAVLSQIGLMSLYARLESLPVIVSEQYPQGLGSTRMEIRNHLGDYPHHTLSKTAFGCADDEKMTQLLASSGCKKIILVGMETHICVYLTALGLLKRDYEVFVCHDATIARQSSHHENGLSLIQSAGGIVANAETLIFQMMGCSGGATFKEISRYLKAQKQNYF